MLENLEPKKPKRTCKIAELMNSLDKKDKEILIQALANPDWTSKGLARELTARGLAISETPIYRHRRKECPC